MIDITKPFLPPIEEYQEYLAAIWERNWLTNNGPLVNSLELKLKQYLGLKHLLFTSNGTIALQIAIKALGIKGEVITTPFSYVASTSSLVWEGCTPKFVDIDPYTFNINTDLIEEAITEKTKAILATHVYGNPCDINAIDTIAQKHNLKIIYDAAHCFGTKYNDRSVLEYGDVSTISFHATKLYHTIEGGAVVTQDAGVLKRMAYLRNFGHDGPGQFNGVGINGKNSELHAAMGLANLKYVDQILEKRKSDYSKYDQWLNKLNLQKVRINSAATFNHAYYPVVFESQDQCLNVFDSLERHKINARRYFYPALSMLDYVSSQKMPVAEDISKRVLCLPMYQQITTDEIELVCRIILRTMKY